MSFTLHPLELMGRYSQIGFSRNWVFFPITHLHPDTPSARTSQIAPGRRPLAEANLGLGLAVALLPRHQRGGARRPRFGSTWRSGEGAKDVFHWTFPCLALNINEAGPRATRGNHGTVVFFSHLPSRGFGCESVNSWTDPLQLFVFA